MPSIQKLAIIALVMIVMGALQFAVPAFSNKSQLKQSTESQQNIPPQPLKNHFISDVDKVEGGTLYFVSDRAGQTKQDPPYTLSPLLQTDVDIKITGIIARTRLTQTFKNASDDWVNGTYVFPLPENAAVDHLLMTIGDRKIEGKIKEKKQALKIYNQAKKQGKKASLITQQRPNVFTNSVANIGPRETIEISIEYQQTLDYKDQKYSLRFPMTITPRYTPPDTSDSKLENTPVYHASKSTNKVNLVANLKTGFELKNLESEFHTITTKRLSDGSRHIELSEAQVANKDFVLSWQPELSAQPQISHFKQNVDGEEYGLIMLLPPQPQQESNTQAIQTNREVIFVLDTSGSMEGESIVQAKQALILAVNQLANQDSFNLIEFNSYAQNLWSSPKIASNENKSLAIEFVAELQANGGTHMSKAFNLAFEQPPSAIQETQEQASSRLRQIVFITDGSVSNEESLMSLIEQNINQSRLFTVGIGSAPNSYFMTEAAKMGKGTFTYIGSTSQVKDKMQALLNKLSHPALTNVELQVDTHKLTNNKFFEIYPNKIGDLYLGEALILSYRQKPNDSELIFSEGSEAELTLSGMFQNKPWSSQLQSTSQTRHSGLNVLWAREKIAQLTRDKRRASISSNNSLGTPDEYRSMITQTALKHHIVSQYTSLVAVDITPTKPASLNAKHKNILNRFPAGSHKKTNQQVGQLPQTATNAELKLLIGLILMGVSLCTHCLLRRRERLCR
ncbi:marine proteobacterial sortase target protein [Paraglaciecola sp.]|uniref:marine proteobacterial sortase target protein n=1 Tax=Paraglaciecola sp. TaxID=1920173 RepID=UPI003EF973C4